jgi:hypothetical protein
VSAPAEATALCRGCRAPLAPDQRYCLGCGLRVADARVAYLDLLASDDAARAAVAARANGGTPAPVRAGFARQLDRVGGPMGAAAVVLVALGVGFLLGQGNGGGPATVIQRPPVVNVQGGGVAAAPTTGSASGDTSGSGRGSKSKSASPGTKGIPTAPAQDNSGGNINKLKSQPTDVATPGAPPPKDNKPSGGGSAATSIG